MEHIVQMWFLMEAKKGMNHGFIPDVLNNNVDHTFSYDPIEEANKNE